MRSVLIVDDEEIWREVLRIQCESLSDVHVTACCATLEQALVAVGDMPPDVILLDVELANGVTGFDLLPRLTPRPAVIFITSHAEFAVRAFRENALHYLLKPCTHEDLEQALQRLPPHDVEDRLHFLLRVSGCDHLVNAQDILAVQAVGDYTRLLRHDLPPLVVHKKMKEWERDLPASRFKRVDRSLLVRIGRVTDITTSRDGHAAEIHLQGLAPLTCARSAIPRIRKLLRETG